jgi:predicted MFS family arabinose efflux permease
VTPRRHEAAGGIGAGLLSIMAVASGIAVANLYYIQPLLADIGRAFGASPPAMGVIVMLGQIGFAIGVLLFVPLGDISDRRRLILLMLTGAAISLMGVAMATSYVGLAAAIFFVGLFSVSPQMFVPFAAHLAAPERRGRSVGIVMSGLVIGILLSRAASGYIGNALGWRVMYWIASVLTLSLAIVVALSLPRSTAGLRLPYGRLLGSMWQLIRTEPVLRESALSAAMLFGAFSAFWSMLAFRLETPPLHYGSQVAGLFGLIGIAGAGAAPIAGRLADRLDPRVNVRVALIATALAFVILAAAGHTIAGLAAGIIVLDAGVQAGHVTNQSRIFNLLPEARNRLNTVYMVSFFLGGAAGSVLAANAWQRWGWAGVCAVGLAMPAIAAIRLSLPESSSGS